MNNEKIKEIESVYFQLIQAWNKRNAKNMAKLFTENGELIGFDGSQAIGSEQIFSHLEPIFQDHPTPPFITKVKNIHFLSSDIVLLRAIAGMIQMGQTDFTPELHTHHTLVAVKTVGDWKIQLFQNTPAQYHGRPEMVEQMTAELREQLRN